MITGGEGHKEDTGVRALTATHSTEVGHLITPAEFQKKRDILGQLHGPSQDCLHLAQRQIQSRGSQTPPSQMLEEQKPQCTRCPLG